MIRNIFKAFAVFALLIASSSCSDFLDQESDHVIYADKSHLDNATDTIYSVIGIMNKMQAIADRTILLGELRGDLIDINEKTSSDLRDVALFNVGNDNKYNSPRDYYAIINNCNYFIAKADVDLKNNRNETIFLKEYAAVKAFRAWTYLQLVLNYGSVPFFTDPILSKAEADYDYPKKNIQEVCQYFINDIAEYADIETPGYGTIRSNDSKLFYFPIYILLGDLNLWAGNYKEAALNYYKYISTRNGTNGAYPTGSLYTRWSQRDSHWRSMTDAWSGNCFGVEGSGRNSELITMIPGDSIPSEGNYSELRDLFNSNESNEYQVSLRPSQSIIDLSAAQNYCHLSSGNDVVYAPTGLSDYRTGDLRLCSVWTTYDNVRVRIGGSIREVTDYSSLYKYSSRNVHIYRRTMVYLRMAEALNRAGYPRFAFEILKNGVNNRSIETNVIPYYTADSTWIRQFNFPNNDYVLESRSGQQSENTMGIHGHGSGYSFLDDLYAMPDDTLITDSLKRIDYQIDKVEDLIMDEEALEFAFEGYRFYDLMRVALRRGDPTYLANRVYKRKGADQEGLMRGLIKRDLNDTRSWYLNWNNKIGLGY
jgi:hypothetical protein